MPADADFLGKILENPADDTARLVYADWLEEQADPLSTAKAEFLRLTCRLTTLGKKHRQRRQVFEKRLQELAADLDTDWLAVVSRLKIELCAGKRAAAAERVGMRLAFDFVCDKTWDQLRPTDVTAARFCDSCEQTVHYCDTIMEARRHAGRGHCIAVDLGIVRRDDDLQESPRRMLLGRVTADRAREVWARQREAERERLKPDPVSAAREARKRETEAPRDG